LANGADLASAYTLAAIVSIIFNNPITSSSFEFLIIGTFISAVLAIAEPIDRIAATRLAHLLETSAVKGWANHVVDMVVPKTPAWEQNVLKNPESRDNFLRWRSRRAFWQPYLAKQRARLTSGTLIAITLGTLSPYLLLVEYTPTRVLYGVLAIIGAAVILWSLRRRLRNKVPEYCWVVCAYGLVAEFLTKDPQSMQLLARVRRFLIDEEWDEARQWLTQFAPY